MAGKEQLKCPNCKNNLKYVKDLWVHLECPECGYIYDRNRSGETFLSADRLTREFELEH